MFKLSKDRKIVEIVFLRNGLLGGGLSIMSAIQANYFYSLGFNVTVIIDQSYSEKLFASSNAKMYNSGIKIIPALTTDNYLTKMPQVKRRSERESWFGGTISKYYDEYGQLIKTTWHDSDKQRVKIEIPIVEEYLSNLKEGDIVIAMEASLGWYLGYLELPKGVSKIYQHHNQHFYLSPWIDNSEAFSAVIVLTSKTKETYEKLYGKKDNFYIIGNPLRMKIPTEIISHNKRKLKIVSVGRLSEGKQPLDAIKAFEIINRELPESFLEFYGTGNLESELKKYISDNNLVDKVFFKGYEKDISKIFSDASLMIFPTKREALPLVILEAFAYGVPVVAYSTTFGVDDLIDNDRNGYVVKQKDIEALAQKSIDLLKDTQKREKFSQSGKEKVKEYEYSKVMNQYFKLLRQVSNIEIRDIDLKVNLIKRKKLPQKMENYILSKNYSNDELNKILSYLKTAKAKIIDGSAYIYNEKIVDYIPLEVCKVY